MSKAILMMAVVTIFGTGCAVVGSSQVDQSTVYTQYSARYDETTRSLELSASFTVGGEFGTYLELDGLSAVSVDGTPLSKETGIFHDVSYVLRKNAPTSADLSRGYTFRYVNNDGKAYVNTVWPGGALALGAGQASSASLRSRYPVRWEAPAGIRPGETVTAKLSRKDGSASTSRSDAGGGSTGQLVFDPDDLTTLGAGPARLQLCRGSSSSTLDAPKGGTLSSSYCTTTLDVTIQP